MTQKEQEQQLDAEIERHLRTAYTCLDGKLAKGGTVLETEHGKVELTGPVEGQDGERYIVMGMGEYATLDDRNAVNKVPVSLTPDMVTTPKPND